MMLSGLEIFVLVFLLNTQEGPQDLLSLVAPDVALEIVGEEPSVDNLRGLIRGRPSAEPTEDAGAEVSKTAESAIQNLASGNATVVERAREQLIEEGPAVRSRLEEVVEKDPRRAAEAKKVLEALAGKERASGHGTTVARIVAIRYAGANGIEDLASEIEAALASDDPFVRLAAQDALVRLEKREASALEPVVETDLDPVRLEALPEDTRLLVTLRLGLPGPGDENLTVQSFASKMAEGMGEAAVGGFQAEVYEISREIVSFVKTYGNVRPERVAVANVGGITGGSAGLGIIVEGIYDRYVLEQALADHPLWSRTDVEGHAVFNSPFVRLVPLSDRAMLVLPVLASNGFPLASYLKSLQGSERPLAKHERFARFISTVNDSMLVRGLALTDQKLMSWVHEQLRGAAAKEISDAVEAMKEIELTVAPVADGKSRLRLEADFADASSASALSKLIRSQVDQGIQVMEARLESLPPIPLLRKLTEKNIEVLKSTTVAAEGTKGILRMELPEMGVEDIAGLGVAF